MVRKIFFGVLLFCSLYSFASQNTNQEVEDILSKRAQLLKDLDVSEVGFNNFYCGIVRIDRLKRVPAFAMMNAIKDEQKARDALERMNPFVSSYVRCLLENEKNNLAIEDCKRHQDDLSVYDQAHITFLVPGY